MASDTDRPTKVPTWWEDSPPAAEQAAGYEPASQEEICRFVNETCWTAWDGVYRPWRKQVEENVRLVTGRHYDAFLNTIGEVVDIAQFVSNDERWREQPVFNFIQHYYKLTLSKLTENTPLLVSLPAGADYADAVLAQVIDPIWRFEWAQMQAPQKMFSLYGWVILAARAITRIRWDPDRGPKQNYTGPAIIQQFAGGQATGRRSFSDVPYVLGAGGQFVPNLVTDKDGQPVYGEDGQPRFGAPYSSRAGDLAFDVLPPSRSSRPTGPRTSTRRRGTRTNTGCRLRRSNAAGTSRSSPTI